MVRKILAVTVLTGLTALTASSALAAQLTAPVKRDGILVDDEYKTLYTNDTDPAGKSVCNDECAKAWTPLFATSASKKKGEYSVIKRADGKRQWAYKGKPLYTSPNDKKSGDKTGDNADGVWHIVQ